MSLKDGNEREGGRYNPRKGRKAGGERRLNNLGRKETKEGGKGKMGKQCWKKREARRKFRKETRNHNERDRSEEREVNKEEKKERK